MEESRKLTGLPLYGIMLGMLLTGTANTIVLKLQDIETTPMNDPKGNKYNHPFFQCACMFLGEVLCLVTYGCIVLYERRKAKEGDPTPASPGTRQAE